MAKQTKTTKKATNADAKAERAARAEAFRIMARTMGVNAIHASPGELERLTQDILQAEKPSAAKTPKKKASKRKTPKRAPKR